MGIIREALVSATVHRILTKRDEAKKEKAMAANQDREHPRIPFGGSYSRHDYAPVYLIKDVSKTPERAKTPEQGRETGKSYKTEIKTPSKGNGKALTKDKGELTKSANGAIKSGVIVEYGGEHVVPIRSGYKDYHQRIQAEKGKDKSVAMEM